MFFRRRAAPDPMAHPDVRAELIFFDPGAVRPSGEYPAFALDKVPSESHEIAIANLRRASSPPSLDREGFELVRAPTATRNFTSRSDIAKVYLPAMGRLLSERTGATHVFGPNGAVVRSDKTLDLGAGVKAQPTARDIHTDFDGPTAYVAARALAIRHGLPDLPAGRLSAITVWRCFSPPPQDRPLALCDMRSIAAANLVGGQSAPYDLPGVKSTNRFLRLTFNAAQRWGFFPEMQPDEVLMFKQFDSAMGAVSGCPHASFADPAAPVRTPPRRSIEARFFTVHA